jgi:hypothetical protein
MPKRPHADAQCFPRSSRLIGGDNWSRSRLEETKEQRGGEDAREKSMRFRCFAS